MGNVLNEYSNCWKIDRSQARPIKCKLQLQKCYPIIEKINEKQIIFWFFFFFLVITNMNIYIRFSNQWNCNVKYLCLETKFASSFEPVGCFLIFSSQTDRFKERVTIDCVIDPNRNCTLDRQRPYSSHRIRKIRNDV